MRLNFRGEDCGFDSGDTQFPPIEYMGRYWFREYCATGTIGYLGPAAHAVQDGGQPMHVAGVIGNFHSWWETRLARLFGPGGLDGWWGTGETCTEVYRTSDRVTCTYRWARDLVSRAEVLAGRTPARGDRRVERYLGLIYAVAEASRDRAEALMIRRVIDGHLMATYPPGFCADPTGRFGRPAEVPARAVWVWETPQISVRGRAVHCAGGYQWIEHIRPDSALGCIHPPPPIGDCTEIPSPYPDNPEIPPLWCEWACRWEPILFNAAGYRECPQECDACRTGGVCTYEYGSSIRQCPLDCPGMLVDAELAALPSLRAQAAEQVDRQIAAALAFLYLAATDCAGASDRDGDMILDDVDTCPDWDDARDRDLDGIGDACDLCPDFPARWGDYARNPLDGLPKPGDIDGDGLGDRCDPCPRLSYWCGGSWHPGERTRRTAARDPADIMDGIQADWDIDGDGIANYCDNCRLTPNPDQVNCNKDDEFDRWTRAPGRNHCDFRGTGDACDATPCLAKCHELMGGSSSLVPGPIRCERGYPCISVPGGGQACPVNCRLAWISTEGNSPKN
ncbi:MAG: thrombospondin type 3 repeat-containing protein [Myxococcota bacterium]|nr:thrombospondin type 3 repeat-containing protein [Myxococcota bacterium]